MTQIKSGAGIWAGIHSELVLKMKLNPKNDDITTQPFLKCNDKYQHQVWSLLDDNGYLLDWIARKGDDYIKPLFESALHNEGIFSVSKSFPVWKIVFAETMLFDVDNKPLVLEDYQKDLLLNPSNKQAWCLSRRLGKSFDCHVDATAYAICKPPTYNLIVLQSWDTAKDALIEIDEWIERNPLILKFAKGRRQWQVTNKSFGNGSRISCRTATKPQKMRSKNPDRVYEDEKAFYPSGTAELSTMRIGHSLKRQAKQARMVMSSPNGIDNDFERLFDKKLFPLYSTTQIPICEEIIWDEEKLKTGLRQPLHFKNIISRRISEEDLLGQWAELGQTLFMQDYMLERTSYEGGAIPEWVINMFFDDKLETKMKSELPCVIAFDLGKSEHHRSTIGVGEIQSNGILNIIRLYTFPIGTPFWRGVVDGVERSGVFDTVLNWCNFYNVYKVIGDATGMGVEDHFLTFLEELETYGVPMNNVIAYPWSRQSDKYLGKSTLFQSLVLPTIETGKIHSVFDKQLRHEMRSWQGRKTDSGNVIYKPMRIADRDDLWMMVMTMVYAVFHKNLKGQPMPHISSAPSAFPRRQQSNPQRIVRSIKTSHRDNYRKRRR